MSCNFAELVTVHYLQIFPVWVCTLPFEFSIFEGSVVIINLHMTLDRNKHNRKLIDTKYTEKKETSIN
jgi:hypothetical protein